MVWVNNKLSLETCGDSIQIDKVFIIQTTEIKTLDLRNFSPFSFFALGNGIFYKTLSNIIRAFFSIYLYSFPKDEKRNAYIHVKYQTRRHYSLLCLSMWSKIEKITSWFAWKPEILILSTRSSFCYSSKKCISFANFSFRFFIVFIIRKLVSNHIFALSSFHLKLNFWNTFKNNARA